MSDPNYITREGAQKLQDELGMLRSKERPKVVQEVADAAAQGDRSENAEYKYGKQRLREIDRRMRFLTKRLEAASIVTPQANANGRIFFGAWVSVEDEDGAQSEYRIVGEDEIDLRKKCISWRSPLGRALLKKEEGDIVKVQRPTGDVELTIVAIRY
ncbi:MAG TPA: transcription elongation factor GreB [Polyangiales bacterium]|jgi:transcription elongation factor GreB|nr:transcription elongation factor GreB [Polyangiales bacterium]